MNDCQHVSDQHVSDQQVSDQQVSDQQVSDQQVSDQQASDHSASAKAKSKQERKDTCNELKNIQYQSMLLNTNKPNQSITNTNENMNDLDDFFNKEKELNKSLPWLKLDKSVKHKKLTQYAKKYTSEHQMNKEDTQELGYYLKDCLERRKLQKQKDLMYDKNTGIINNIPGLQFNKNTRKFTLKSTDKKQSITKGLAPKTTKKTLKKKSREKER